jgi:cyclopropane fatty-acyl-phospholipid synthase-like methyltransferase
VSVETAATSPPRDRGGDINLRSGPQMREYEAIADRVAASAPGRVLDWGCGWGQVSHLLLERGVDVTSLEYRPEATEGQRVALERFPDVEALLTGEPVRLPFADDSFETALSVGVLEHVGDPDGSLDELRRVLVPGGRLYVYKLPNRHSYLERLARRMGLYYHGALPDDQLYTTDSARGLLERHGFAVESVRRANMLPLTLSHPVVHALTPLLWAANRVLARVPGLNRFATNVEAVAVAR